MTASLRSTAAVIVTYASALTIERALRTLPLADLATTVVVDNASPDDTVAVVQGAGRSVALVENGVNAGFGAACNVGLARVGDVEYVLFLNPDAAIAADDLARLVAYLDTHPSCGLVAPRLRRGAEPLTSCGSMATFASEMRTVAPAALARRLPDRRYPPSFDRPGPVGYVEGACMLARRDALVEAGGFDERYFLFYEELDLARRLAAAGFTVDLCPAAAAEHAVAVSRATLPMAGRAHLRRSAAIYLARWHGRPAALTYQAAAAVQARRHRRTPAGSGRLRTAPA